MTTVTANPERASTRHYDTRANLERYGFLFLRLSGVALLLLAVGHMLLQHIFNDVHALTLEFVRQQWSSWGWRVYDLGLLIFAVIHGFVGLRQVLHDYIHNSGTIRVVSWIIAIFTVVTVLWSAVAILTFNPNG
jgi:succinate dehydrogenase / fumarate reductase membrane anchor subunit